ncbi:MAG TPA: DUF5320 domain-containing protein [Candidatus Aminicenantes bacterium]|nr:DUF5320 domain-containing protein [Candidatus Aminicenantes bacterium]
MPGFDGTGPRGQGPMSGHGHGYCLMNLPDGAGGPQAVFAGPVGEETAAPGLHSLRLRLQALRDGIASLRARLRRLEGEGRLPGSCGSRDRP